MLALGWPEVDLKAGKIRIVFGLSKGEAGRAPEIGELKTARARRELVLLPVVVERLRQWKKEQNERRLKLGPAWNDLDLVCDRGDGMWLTPDAFTDAAKRIMAKAGLDPRTRLHDL